MHVSLKGKRARKRKKNLVLSFMTLYVAFIALSFAPSGTWVYAKETDEAVVESLVVAPDPQTMIEVHIEWTRERLEKEILKQLPPVFIKIARCESEYRYWVRPRNTDGSYDNGLLQINDLWRSTWERLGLDMMNPQDNVTMAVYVYEAQGLQAWSASEHCWNK